MDVLYNIKTSKNEFSLVYGEYPNLGISLCIPDFLIDIFDKDNSEEHAPLEIPNIIKVCKTYGITFTLHSTKAAYNEKENSERIIAATFSYQKDIISRTAPGYQCHEVACKKISNFSVFVLEYSSEVTENRMYNLFFMFMHNNQIIYGNFSCYIEDAEEYEMVFKMCVNTIKNMDKDKKEN